MRHCLPNDGRYARTGLTSEQKKQRRLDEREDRKRAIQVLRDDFRIAVKNATSLVDWAILISESNDNSEYRAKYLQRFVEELKKITKIMDDTILLNDIVEIKKTRLQRFFRERFNIVLDCI